MATVASHGLILLPTVERCNIRGDTLREAVLWAPKKRKHQSDGGKYPPATPPAKKRRVWYHDGEYKVHHNDLRRSEDGLVASHAQHHILNHDFDDLTRARNTPPDITTSGPLPPVLISRNGHLDGLAAIHNAPSGLLGPLPPIKSLDDSEVVREIYEKSPLRPWQLVGSQPSLLIDMERMATEQLENRASFLNDNGTVPSSFAESDWVSWDQVDLREELLNLRQVFAYDRLSPDYGTQATITPPEEQDHIFQLDEASAALQPMSSPYYAPSSYYSMLDYGYSQYHGMSADQPVLILPEEPNHTFQQDADFATTQLASSPPIEGPFQYFIPELSDPIWSPQTLPSPLATPQHCPCVSRALEDTEAEFASDSSSTLYGDS
ncbi:hypothetical protein FGG08_006283 [Glutinoglossum americanum]|uniref:Uncharacterized protein n=1 Tax=Glutinoglossum americanum TaxID=1670608 RepID=A0A9P8I7P6_9PEZI|nr:hypothetical protein FGG08_006283 [Glutinoglossum americanum]